MGDIEAKIRELEEEIRKTPYNKATQHHIGLLKARIAKLKQRLDQFAKRKGGGRSFAVKKHGDATVVMVGPPSVGKSTLLNALTNAESEVGAYDFTTLDVIPGMLEYKHAKIQLLDIPGIIGEAHAGRGRGKEIMSIARNADLIMVIGENVNQIKAVEQELEKAGLRLNKRPPDVKIKKLEKGGIRVSFGVACPEIDERLVRDVLREYGYHNAEVLIREKIGFDELIDALYPASRKYVKAIRVVNKVDALSKSEIEEIKKNIPDAIFISAEKGTGLDELKERIFKSLDLIRVYTKKIGKEPNLNEPIIVRRGSTLEDVCLKIHKDFVKKFRFARLWGKSVKFSGQRVGLGHRLQDGDIVEIHAEK